VSVAGRGDGGYHVPFYNFDLVDGGATGIGDWSTFGNGAIVSSADDSALESNSTPGSLHPSSRSPVQFIPVLERFYSQPIDLSCYSRMHSWVRSPRRCIPQGVPVYVLAADFLGAFGPYFAPDQTPSIADIADGNWHELITTLSGNMSAIVRIGYHVYPLAARPR